MLKSLNAVLACLWVALLSSCASDQTTSERYYLSSDIPASAFDNMQVKVQLNEILNTGGIVLEQNDVNVYVAKSNRWASNLAQQLSAIFYTRIKDLDFSQGVRFILYFSKFNGSLDGFAHIIMSVRMVGEDGKEMLVQDYVYREPVLEDGYQALVQALKAGYMKLIDDFIAGRELAAISGSGTQTRGQARRAEY